MIRTYGKRLSFLILLYGFTLYSKVGLGKKSEGKKTFLSLLISLWTKSYCTSTQPARAKRGRAFNFLWFFCGFSAVFLQFFCGFSAVFLQFFCSFSAVFLQFFCGFVRPCPPFFSGFFSGVRRAGLFLGVQFFLFICGFFSDFFLMGKKDKNPKKNPNL